MYYRVIMPPYEMSETRELVPCLEAIVQAANEEEALIMAYDPGVTRRESSAGLCEWDDAIVEPAAPDAIMAAVGAARLPGLE